MRAFLKGSRAVELMRRTGLSRPLEKRLLASRWMGAAGGRGCINLVRELGGWTGVGELAVLDAWVGVGCGQQASDLPW